MPDIEKDKVIAVLNQILESELAGVVRYTHYSFLVFGFGRIPIVSWLRQQLTNHCCTRIRRANGSRRSASIRR